MSQLVRTWMTRDVLGVGPRDTARRALEMMEDQQLRHLLVLEGPSLVGILSNRDIIRVTLQNSGRILDLDGCPVDRIMTPAPLETVDPNTTLQEAARRMHRLRVSALPVMSGDLLEGIISHDDLLLAMAEGAG